MKTLHLGGAEGHEPSLRSFALFGGGKNKFRVSQSVFLRVLQSVKQERESALPLITLISDPLGVICLTSQKRHRYHVDTHDDIVLPYP